MARKTAIIKKNQERAVIIGAGITERWYFSHMQSLFGLKVKIRPRYFGNESIYTLERLIKQVLDDEGLAIVVFDTDVSTWNESENKKLAAVRQR